MGVQLTQFLGLFVLARLVTPAEFGSAAIVASITAFATLLVNSGVGAYTVHVRDLDKDVLSTTFWLNATAGVCLAVVAFAAADWVAVAFRNPDLTQLVRLSSVAFACGFGATHLGLLERSLRFRRIAALELAAAVTGQLIAIVLAARGKGAFAVVMGAVATSVLVNVLYVVAAADAPALRFRTAVARDVWRYARYVLGFNVVNYWARNLDNLIIGRYAGPQVLGLYSRAYSLMLVPVNQVPTIVGRVLLPTLARQQDSPAAAVTTWSRAATASWLIGLPIAAVAVVCPEDVLRIALGSQWTDAAPYLRVLALAVPPQLFSRPSGALFQALGRTPMQMRVGLINTAIAVAGMVLGYLAGGPVGLTWGLCAALYVNMVVLVLHIRGGMQLRARPLARDLALSSAGACVATVAGVGVATALSGLGPLVRVAAVVVAVMVVYAFFVLRTRLHRLLRSLAVA